MSDSDDAGGRQVSEPVTLARHALVEYGRRMLRDGLVVGTAGNLSALVDGVVVITPTSMRYEDLQAEDVSVLTLDGDLVAGKRPSSEWYLHRRVYDLPNASAVVHTHSPWAVSVSATFADLPAIHYAIHRLGGDTVPVAPYQTFGTEDLASAAASVLIGRYAVLLANHGAVTYGQSLAEAYDRAVLLEWLARVYCQAKMVGQPAILSAAQLAEVRAEAGRRAYQGTAR
jgi:L-fuculose-phosphate aldolase